MSRSTPALRPSLASLLVLALSAIFFPRSTAANQDSLISESNRQCRSYVQEFDNQRNFYSFQEEINRDPDTNWVVMLYANWCGYSQGFAPYYNTLAERYHTDPDNTRTRLLHNFKFAAVDCGHKSDYVYDDICNKLKVTSYPRLLFLSGKDSAREMVSRVGDRHASNIKRSKVKQLDTWWFDNEMQDFKQQTQSSRSHIRDQPEDRPNKHVETQDNDFRRRDGPGMQINVVSKQKLAKERSVVKSPKNVRKSSRSSSYYGKGKLSPVENEKTHHSQKSSQVSRRKVESPDSRAEQVSSRSSTVYRYIQKKLKKGDNMQRFCNSIYDKALIRSENAYRYGNLFYGICGSPGQIRQYQPKLTVTEINLLIERFREFWREERQYR